MNWINKYAKRFLLSLFFCLSVLLVIFLFWSLLESKIENKITKLLENDTVESLKSVEPTREYSEISPDGMREIILYKRIFTGNRRNEYRSYLNNQHLFTVRDFKDGVEQEIFIGDSRVNYPHWLGNNFIFFTGGCGTGCRGFYLVDTRSKKSYEGVITTTPVSKDGFVTHLHDWFDKEFEFIGYDKNIRPVNFNGKTYLIFEMWNNNKPIGEKKFLFTGNALVAQ